MTTFQLNLENESEYMTLFRAIGDSGVRENLKNQSTIDSATMDLIRMIDDPLYVSLATDVKAKYEQWTNGTMTLEALNESASKLQRYTAVTYPEGLKLCNEYAHNMCGEASPDSENPLYLYVLSHVVAAQIGAVVVAAVATPVTVAV